MCKIVALTKMSAIKSPRKAIDVIAKRLASYENDGFGYAIQGSTGVFGERTLSPTEFSVSFGKDTLQFPFLKRSSNRFGSYSKPLGAGIFHGRTSTNDKTLQNTHPIVKHDWTLIHNGVVTNMGPQYPMTTTNDTEHLVHYMANGGLDSLAKNLTGYYAAAAFSPDGALHVFRDDRATLYFAEITEIDSYIIATTRELIEGVCKDMSWKTSVISAIDDNQYIVFRDGAVESNRTFQPRGSTARENKYSSLSLGEIQDWSKQSYAESSYETFTEDENAFFDEVESMDHTYTILDHRENRVPLEDFLAMDPEEQLACIVIRPNGTIADPSDADSETLFQGRIA